MGLTVLESNGMSFPFCTYHPRIIHAAMRRNGVRAQPKLNKQNNPVQPEREAEAVPGCNANHKALGQCTGTLVIILCKQKGALAPG